jgi:hypothetical protein
MPKSGMLSAVDLLSFTLPVIGLMHRQRPQFNLDPVVIACHFDCAAQFTSGSSFLRRIPCATQGSRIKLTLIMRIIENDVLILISQWGAFLWSPDM